jgi:type VI secretion system secreted protein Hcp
MPSPMYLYVEGQKQGKIEGSCDIKGREGSIMVQATDDVVNIPKSPQTGLPTGKRVHNPFSMTAELDKATPKLYQALASGEQLKTVKLDFFRINKVGTEEKYFTYNLQNAIVVSMRQYTPMCLDPDNGPLGHMVDIAFTYEKVTWTWAPDGIEGEDSWKG